jgi:hypothetical protein
MITDLPKPVLPDLIGWPLRATTLDDFARRSALSASTLYALGILILNMGLSGFDAVGLTPVRSAAIPVGLVCVLVDAILLLPYGLLRKLLQSWRPQEERPVAALGVLALGFLIDMGAIYLFMGYAYNHLGGYDAPNWPDAAILSVAVLVQAVAFALSLSQVAWKSASAWLLLIIILPLFMYRYVNGVYDMIPLWSGGGKVALARLVVKADAKPSLEAAGFKVNENGVTSVVELLQESDTSVSIIGRRTANANTTTSSVSPFEYKLSRSEIIAVVSKPVGWSDDAYKNDDCWADKVPVGVCK